VNARIRLAVEDGIAHVVLSSPPRNALDLACFAELSAMARDVLPGLDAIGLVISGEGRHFSSGADVDELGRAFRADLARGAALTSEHAGAVNAIARLPYPTAAAISGSCLGAALELALACRFRAVATRAVLALPEVEFGLMPGLGGIARLTALVGRARAMELVLSGRTLGAEEALRIGLVDAVAERGAVLGAAVALVRGAARLVPRGVGG
jgi:enoyl-CoA hydratase/carnithine racemase